MVKVAYGKHSVALEVVDQCRQQLGPVAPHLLLAFCGGKHDPHAVLAAIRAAFGPDVPVVGGSAVGAVWCQGQSYSGLELAIAAFDASAPVPEIVVTHGLDQGEEAAGKELGERIAAAADDDAVVIFFYDSVASASPLRLHPGGALVAGIYDGLGDRRVRLIGGGTLTDMNLSDGWIFDGRGVAKHAAAALVFPKGVGEETVVLHGCRPASSFMEITRIEGAEVYELDGQPALEVIERLLGISLADDGGQELSLIATLGEKQGDPFAPYDEKLYVNRLILQTNRATGSITLFEPDFRKGTRVQVMSRDNALMLESVRDGVAALNGSVAGRENLLALYIDCAGRASARSGSPVEEASLVSAGLDPAIPLLGFYSGVEIAPFGGYSRPLDWTGVLTILHRTA